VKLRLVLYNKKLNVTYRYYILVTINRSYGKVTKEEDFIVRHIS